MWIGRWRRKSGLASKTRRPICWSRLNNSAQIAPNFWVNPSNSVSYPLVVQEPTYRINSLQDLKDMPLATDTSKQGQLLMNIATFGRTQDSDGDVAIEHPPGF